MISLRKAGLDDLLFYLKLRNDPSTKKFQFNPEPVELEQHKKWFETKLKDPNAYLFVIEDNERKGVGQVRIDVSGQEAETDIAIIPEERGKGYSTPAIQAAIRSVFQETPHLKVMKAYIKPENTGSLATFVKAGFTRQGETLYKENQCILMTYERV